MIKFLKDYIKTFFAGIFLFCLSFLICLAVFTVYRIDAGAVLYSALLCLLAALLVVLYKGFKAYRASKQLDAVLYSENISAFEDALPETEDFEKQKYQRIIRRLISENRRLYSSYENERTDMYDYYTLWAHQIKTPISAMHLILETTDSDKRREIENELFKIEQYVEMVLGYIRLDSDTNDLLIKEYDIDGIIKSSVKKFSKQFILKRLSLNYTETGIRAVTDKKQLGFVLEQLISNALKYTKSGSVSIYGEDSTVIIKDTGIGIAPEDLPRICEKGYTGEIGRADGKSTGLGLYLCRRTLEKLNHTFKIESEPGVGTTVKINLYRENIDVE